MTQEHLLTEALMALLNIQNNVGYIEKELDVLQIDEADKNRIKHITSPYFAALYECQEELAALCQEFNVYTIDPLLTPLTDDKNQTERIGVILRTLHEYNMYLAEYTDNLIAKRDSFAGDTQYGVLLVLLTESVGNILDHSHRIYDILPTITTNN